MRENICNIQIKMLATYVWKHMKQFEQRLQHVQYPPIYFCNIHMKQLQHVSETSETIEIYICNIGGKRFGSVEFGRRGGSQRWAAASEHHLAPALVARASTTTTSATDTGIGLAAMVREGHNCDF
jgi:hypothetical protein